MNRSCLLMSVKPLAMSSGNADLPKSQWLKDKIAEKEAITIPDWAINSTTFAKWMPTKLSQPSYQKASFHIQQVQLYLADMKSGNTTRAPGFGFSSRKVID